MNLAVRIAVIGFLSRQRQMNDLQTSLTRRKIYDYL